MIRYGVIESKNPREIVLLRGSGCKWRRCAFCDYHTDFSLNEEENFELNRGVLSKVTGLYGHLEVINSGSFPDLDEKTMAELERVCRVKRIKLLHFECHYMHRAEIPALRRRFSAIGVEVKIKTGVETFDYDFRENVLKKGIPERDAQKIAEGFDEVCLLFGITGQSEESMRRDLETGLKYFERVCVNIMTANSTPILPDKAVRDIFIQKLYPELKENPRVDVLMENTDFGVGGEGNEK